MTEKLKSLRTPPTDPRKKEERNTAMCDGEILSFSPATITEQWAMQKELKAIRYKKDCK